jgi:hypothetical protein
VPRIITGDGIDNTHIQVPTAVATATSGTFYIMFCKTSDPCSKQTPFRFLFSPTIRQRKIQFGKFIYQRGYWYINRDTESNDDS